MLIDKGFLWLGCCCLVVFGLGGKKFSLAWVLAAVVVGVWVGACCRVFG